MVIDRTVHKKKKKNSASLIVLSRYSNLQQIPLLWICNSTYRSSPKFPVLEENPENPEGPVDYPVLFSNLGWEQSLGRHSGMGKSRRWAQAKYWRGSKLGKLTKHSLSTSPEKENKAKEGLGASWLLETIWAKTQKVLNETEATWLARVLTDC